MRIKYLLPFLTTALLLGCEKERIESPGSSNSSIELYSREGVNVKVSFAKVIAKAATNPAIRQLLADKAMLQFDKDYDVLYHQIKNEVVDGRTLDAYIKELASEAEYNSFNRTPLLTVFIPRIQQAATTRLETTPWIAVRDHDDKLVAYNAAGESKELDVNVLPQFPVMVVKENERVVYENTAKKAALKGRFLFESEGNRYFFSNDEFDSTKDTPSPKSQPVPSSTTASQARLLPISIVDPEVVTAYNNSLSCNTCPQGDWVYYGIYPPGGANQGSMNIKYSEAITSVQFENTNVFSTIGGWDEGNYELYVSVFFSGASTGVFSSVLKVISVSPNDMFEFSDSQVSGTKMYVPSNLYTIAPWDMQAYGSRWAFKVEEYDPETKKTSTYSNSSTYGTDFKVDGSATIAKVVKIGTEFGTTSTTQNNNSYTYETTDANDILGGAVLTWTDPILARRARTRIFFFYIDAGDMGTITTGTTRLGVGTVRITP